MAARSESRDDLFFQVDILHPFATLEWRECRGPPVTVDGAQAVWLNDKVYVGGGRTSLNKRDDARLYIYTPTTDSWTILDTESPVYRFALTIYHSQLVLVGGNEYVSETVDGSPTNKLWTLREHGQWQETLPPMPLHHGGLARKSSAVSHGDHLLVISDNYPNNKVYIYNGHHWASAQHPPDWLYLINSTIFNSHWYLMGRQGLKFEPQKTCVYSASLESLLASCQSSETSQPSSVWKRLADVPCEYCYPTVFGNRLVAVGVGLSSTTPIYIYSSFTQSWVHVKDAPLLSSDAAPLVIVLPSNELIIVKGQTAWNLSVKGK